MYIAEGILTELIKILQLEVLVKAENKFYPELYPINELTVQGVAKAVVRSL